jgi:hypothetical protein
MFIANERLKVGDVGVAMSFEVVRKSTGTLHYTPPEILAKGADCDVHKFKELYTTKSDIW